MHSYLELDMYASLEVHTETTIQNGQQELLVFEEEVLVCIKFGRFASF